MFTVYDVYWMQAWQTAHIGGRMDANGRDRASLGLAWSIREPLPGARGPGILIKCADSYGTIKFYPSASQPSGRLYFANLFCCESLEFHVTRCSCYKGKMLCFYYFVHVTRAHQRHICRPGLPMQWLLEGAGKTPVVIWHWPGDLLTSRFLVLPRRL